MPDPKVEQRWQAAVAGREDQVTAAGQGFADLVKLMADLRGPQGCPWDAEQSLASLRQYVREEAEEVCQAVDAILEFEAGLRREAALNPADPAPPASDDRARTATKGLSIAHHPHRADYNPQASAAGAPLPQSLPAGAGEQLDRLYRDLFKELGDLLLQPVFMGEILQAMGRGGVEHSLALLVNKLIGRHPHVYGEVEVSDSAEVLVNWERIKAGEK